MDTHTASPPAAHRTFGALQRTLALLQQQLRDDAALRCERWLASAGDEHERALRERAWAEQMGRRPAA